jgi:aldehyde dehydrogenase (NAD+)
MKKTPLHTIYEQQKKFFDSGKTLHYSFRLAALLRLEDALNTYEDALIKALNEDLKKSAFESYSAEIGLIKSEIRFAKRRLKKWMRPRKQRDVLINFPSKNYHVPIPYGLSLIIGPWNYPVQLCLNPLIGGIAAGNTVLLKPSEWAPNVAEVLQRMIAEFFNPAHISVLTGDETLSAELVELDVDHIFFTGSTQVGRLIAQSAGSRLIPCTLELGGKSPCIVDQTADLKITARRIAWGKFMNAGQTCVAPDYVLVDERVESELLVRLKDAITEFYGADASTSPDYPRIVSDKHYNRLVHLFEDKSPPDSSVSEKGAMLYMGGETKAEERYISPTILTDLSLNHPLMEEEIFGPILPVLRFRSVDEIPKIINKNAHPLACYLFSKDPRMHSLFTHTLSFGGGAINDTVAHLGNPYLAFGGVGPSGIGSYHGQHSFETFSHSKSIMKKNFFLDFPFRYPPYKGKLAWIKKLFR